VEIPGQGRGIITDVSGNIMTDFAPAVNLAHNKAIIIKTPDTTGPVHSDIETTTTDKAATLTFKTDEPAVSDLSYRLGGKKGKIITINISKKYITQHAVILRELNSCSRYTYTLTSKDKLDNKTTQTVTIVTKGEKNKKGIYQNCRIIKEGN
jgi:hypothetical protein